MINEIRRLTTMTAKALGLSGELGGLLGEIGLGGDVAWWDDDGNVYQWHRDDGDCARLIAACQIDVSWFPGAVQCKKERYHHGITLSSESAEAFADHGNDRAAALRMCALRIAAKMA